MQDAFVEQILAELAEAAPDMAPWIGHLRRILRYRRDALVKQSKDLLDLDRAYRELESRMACIRTQLDEQRRSTSLVHRLTMSRN